MFYADKPILETTDDKNPSNKDKCKTSSIAENEKKDLKKTIGETDFNE